MNQLSYPTIPSVHLIFLAGHYLGRMTFSLIEIRSFFVSLGGRRYAIMNFFDGFYLHILER